jgi:ribosomal protein L20A (L18A)
MKNNYLLKFEDKSLGFPTFREVRAYTEEEAIKIAGEDLGSDYHLVKIYIEVKNIL